MASGAGIRYTTDGSTPSSTVGTVYSSPVTVSGSQTLKAVAYQSGWNRSSVASAAYTITGEVETPLSFSLTNMGASQPLRFVPITPCRVADTRNPTGPFGGPSIAGGTSPDFVVPASGCGVPATAQAYSLNAAVVPVSGLGYLTILQAGQPRPLASLLNSGRVADTRLTAGSLGGPSLIAGISRTFPVLSATGCGIPAAARAYSLNFAAVPRGPVSFLSAWPTGLARPLISTLNDPTGTVVANAAIVPAGSGGSIDVFATHNTDLVIDIDGYFAPPGQGGLSLYNVVACRVFDSRLPGTAPAIAGSLDVNITASACSIPASAQAFVLNANEAPLQTDKVYFRRV